MSVLRKFTAILIDLLYRPEPSCREKPLERGIMVAIIIGLLAIGFLLWIAP